MFESFGEYMFSLLVAPLKRVRKAINQWYIFFSVIGRIFDDCKKDLMRVRTESMLISCSDIMLQVHGKDRGMPRLKGESYDGYRNRLIMYYLIASEAGSVAAIKYVAQAFGYTNVEVTKNTDPTKWAEATVSFIGGNIVVDDKALLLQEMNKIKPARTVLSLQKEQQYTATVYVGAARIIGKSITLRQV